MVWSVGAPWQSEDDQCRSLCSVQKTEPENPLSVSESMLCTEDRT